MEDFLLFYPAASRFQDLQLRFCGYEECVPGHSYGPAVRNQYLIHIIKSGSGIYQVNQQRYELGSGSGFLIEPGAQTYYEADLENPWTYFWVGFDGSMAPDVIRDLGLGKELLVFQTTKGEALLDVVRFMKKYQAHSSADEYMQQALLYRFLSLLLSDMEVRIPEKGKRNEHVVKAIRYIEENYTRPSMNVSDVADAVNIERGYLYVLFEKYLNRSPKDYLTRFRLTKATELLNHTDLSIEEIAGHCGYQDAVTFSKSFKKMFSLPPSKYRVVSRSRALNDIPLWEEKLEEPEKREKQKKQKKQAEDGKMDIELTDKSDQAE